MYTRRKRRAFTLLELVVTTSLVGITVTSIALLLRSSVTTWDTYDSDHSRLDAAHGVLRHFTRTIRQADRITTITGNGTTNSALTATTVDNQTAVWSINSGRVYFSLAGNSNLIAENISALTFEGFQQDGVTPASSPASIRSIRVSISVQLDRDASSTRVLRCRAWLRVKE